MKQIVILCLALMVYTSLNGQTVKVTGSGGAPLEYVTVYNNTADIVLTTDASGNVNIDAFAESDLITFQLLGYESQAFSKSEIKSSGLQIQLQESNFSLDEVVVSASRWEQSKSSNPARVSTIRPSQIAFENPQTAADLLNISGQVFIQKSQLGGGSPMIRGFATNRLLISVDGVRMNNAIFRSGNLQNVIALDALALDRTEVIFGPGSILYGSDAIGGVMSFYTLTPNYRPDRSFGLSGNAVARYSTASEEKTVHLDLDYGNDRLAFVTSATFTDFDNLRMGSDGPEEYLRPEYVTQINGMDSVVSSSDPEVQVPSGYSQFNFIQKIRFAATDHWDLGYNFQLSTSSDVPRYDRLIEYRNGTLRDGDWYYGPQNWQMHQLIANYANPGKFSDKIRFNLAYQGFEESRHDRGFQRTTINHRTEHVDAISFNADVEKDFGPTNQFYYGIEALYNKVSSDAYSENLNTNEESLISTRYPDGSTWQSYAAYVSYHWKPSTVWTILAGLRFNQVMIKADLRNDFFPFPFEDAENSTGALNGSIGAVLRPGDDWQIKTHISTGFRAPNIDDVGKVFDSEPGNVVIPNPDLSSEYAYNGEISVSKIFADKVLVDVTGFYTYLDNALVRRNFALNGMDSIVYDGTLSQVQAIQNAASAEVWGFQAGLEWKIARNLRFKARLNFQDGYEKDDDDAEKLPLRHVAPLFGRAGLSYSKEKLSISAYAEYSGEFSYEELSPNEQDKPHLYAMDEEGRPFSPAWYTLNVKASYKISEAFQVFAGLENLTDQRYRPYSSGIVAPGINLIISARASF